MTAPLIIDAHMHLYPSKARGVAELDSYVGWEYGTSNAAIRFSHFQGTPEEGLEALSFAGASRGVVVNLLQTAVLKDVLLSELPQGLSSGDREGAAKRIDDSMPDRLREFNHWLCDIARRHTEFAAFVGVDLALMSVEDTLEHLRECAEVRGAQGIKLHPPVQGMFVNDRRLWPVYRLCVELGLTVISHCGPSRGALQYGEPRAFADVLRDFPDLTVVLAHLGGGAWEQSREIASAFPNAAFDCCEILEWRGAPKAPSDEDIARLMQDIGTHRVMLGSDFPWWNPNHTAQRIMELPRLSDEEKLGILGQNARRILKV